MEPDEVAARQVVDDLIVAGDNLLSSAAGPDFGVRLRRDYLGWRQRAEDVLTRSQLPGPLETQRHRDVVRDVVPNDRIFAEVEAEVRAVQRVLRKVVNASPGSAAATEDFTSDRGELYYFDRNTRLGEPGRYGSVFAATDIAGTELAVKEVLIRTDKSHVEAEWRLVNRELEAARLASHRPGLIPVVDHAHLDDRLLVVMPRAERSLAAAIRAGVTPEEAAAAIRDLADALHQLSVAGIVHRDIKPANVLWLNDRWCIADFGIARILDATTGTYTWEGTGTAAYRAPEVWRGEPTTTLSDLYAFGCVAAELLTGRVAFPGPDHRRQHETTLPDLPGDVDPLLTRLVLRLLAKQPELRPQDARSVVELLQPTTGLTESHLALRRRAAEAERRERNIESAEASRRHEREHRDRARVLLRDLWARVADDVRRAVPDAAMTETREGVFLTVADIRIAAVNVNDCSLDDTVVVGDVVVHDGEGSGALLVANLVADIATGTPQWKLVRWHRNDISTDKFDPGRPNAWAGLEYQEFVRQWPLQRHPIAPLIRRTADATPEAVRDLLASVISGADEA